jgi:hypothetical protein
MGEQLRDQIAGDNEEHVDPDIATGEAGYCGMKGNHGDDGECAHAVDVGAIGGRRQTFWCWFCHLVSGNDAFVR